MEPNIFSFVTRGIEFLNICCEIAFRCILHNPIDDKLIFGPGNGLVPSGNKALPEPMLTQIYVTIWRHYDQSTTDDSHSASTEVPKLSYESAMVRNSSCGPPFKPSGTGISPNAFDDIFHTTSVCVSNACGTGDSDCVSSTSDYNNSFVHWILILIHYLWKWYWYHYIHVFPNLIDDSHFRLKQWLETLY